MTSRTYMTIHISGVAMLLAGALALIGCDENTAKSTPTKTPANVEDVTEKFSADPSFYSLKIVRVKIDGGYLYVTSTWKGGVAQTFIPNGR